MKALYIASTGMSAQERNVEIISNNIANMRTTGFKRQRADFQDLLYQVYRRAGSQTSAAGTQLPTGVEIGSGVKTGATPRIMSQGNIQTASWSPLKAIWSSPVSTFPPMRAPSRFQPMAPLKPFWTMNQHQQP